MNLTPERDTGKLYRLRTYGLCRYQGVVRRRHQFFTVDHCGWIRLQLRDIHIEEEIDENPPPKVYTVFGESGEHSDWRLWPVKAFASKVFAEAIAASLNQIVLEDRTSKRRDSKAKRAAFHAKMFAAGHPAKGFRRDWDTEWHFSMLTDNPTFSVEEIDYEAAIQ